MPPVDVFRLLVLEDDEQELDRFSRNIEEFNQESDIKFHHSPVGTASGAIQSLDNHRFDCALLDLRVPKNDGGVRHEKEGNEALQRVVAGYALPVVVHSAYSNQLDETFRDIPVQVIDKDKESHRDALRWFVEQAPLMAAVRETRKRIQAETADIFFKAIWPRWSQNGASTPGRDDLHDVIARQVVSYISEKLTVRGSGPEGHHLHEFYFVPPLREELHTGDLIVHNDGVHVIVTPQCNIANGYPDHFLLAQCKNISGEWAECRRKIADNKGKSSNSVDNTVGKWATQNIDISEHFLPPCDGRGPWLVDFKTIVSVPNAEADNLTENRFASVTPQFIPNLIQRWASYMGRVGQPDLNRSDLIKHIASE